MVETNEQGFKMVNYQGLIPVLLQALKEQQEIISNLSDKVESQEASLKKITEENEDMKKDVALIKRLLLGDQAAQNKE